MNKDTANAIEKQVQLLADYFNVRAPKLIFTQRQRCWYRWRGSRCKAEILIGAKTHWEYTQAVLHEFAHHLEHTRYRGTAERGRYHSPAFVALLVEVCDYWYKGDVLQYDWHREYKQVQKYFNERHRRFYAHKNFRPQEQSIAALNPYLKFG